MFASLQQAKDWVTVDNMPLFESRDRYLVYIYQALFGSCCRHFQNIYQSHLKTIARVFEMVIFRKKYGWPFRTKYIFF